MNTQPIPPLARRAAAHGYRLSRRLIDIGLAALLLALALPFILLALCHGRAAPDQLILREPFIGRGGAIRTMLRIRRAHGGRLALLMERCGIHHAPRLLAILHGHLSFVGPRPRPPHEAADAAPGHARLAATPGLVCLWWLRCRSNIHFGTELEADSDYLRGRSLRGDLAILCRALLVLAYAPPASGHAACQFIAGIRLLNLSMEELIAATLAALKKGTPTRIAFVNPDCVNLAVRDPHYRRCLDGADWICADGIGMKIAGHMLGREIRQNINGTDLFPPLCAALEAGRHSIYLLGARPGVAEQVAHWIASRYPGLRVAGSHSGFFGAAAEAAVIEAIRAARSDVLLVAMGAPLQETWLARHLEATGATIGIGVGGLFDFYSGRIRRAPLWLREIGGEWMYRLLQEPGRMWRRYLIGNGLFLLRIWREKRAAGRATPTTRPDPRKPS